MLIWTAKDPDEVLEYVVDWRHRLGRDTISSVSFTVSSGDVNIDSSDHGDDYSSAKVSAGTVNTTAKILCAIETVDGQTMQETASLLIRAR